VQELRRRGISAFFTMDAGPHVKVLTTRDEAAQVAERVAQIDDVTRVITSAPGGPAELMP